jgi:hypothetical protein
MANARRNVSTSAPEVLARTAGHPDPDRRAACRERGTGRHRWRVMRDVGDQLLARRAADVVDCLKVIPPEQYGQAQRLLDQHTSQVRELLAQTSMPPQRR